MSHEEILLESLKKSVASGSLVSIESLVFDLGMIVMEKGAFPQSCFDEIVHTLTDKKFLGLEGSWKLLRVFEHNWDQLSEQQRSELLLVLEMVYKSFSDWMGQFVISGLLGEL